MLNSFHVPLIDDHNDLLFGALVNGFEEIIVSLVNKCSLELREVCLKRLDEPVDGEGVKRLLSIG